MSVIKMSDYEYKKKQKQISKKISEVASSTPPDTARILKKNISNYMNCKKTS